MCGQLGVEKSLIYKALQPDTNIPQHEIEALARCLLPEIQKFFESPEGKKEFEEWKAQRAKETEKKRSV